MDRRHIVGYVGAGVLGLGTFLPAVSAPVVGTLNYVGNFQGDGVIVLVLAGVSALFVLLSWFKWLWFPAVGAIAVLTTSIAVFLTRLSEAQTSLEQELAGNPFAGLAEGFLATTQVEVGFFVMYIGTILLITAAVLRQPAPVESAAPETPLAQPQASTPVVDPTD